MDADPLALFLMAISVSVIVPAYNEEKYLGDCLAAIVAARVPEVCEVIVVDNGSTDRTGEVAGKFPGVRVVPEPRKGAVVARERGFREARGDVLAYVDADTHISRPWFERIVREFSSAPDLACLSGPYTYYDFPFPGSLLVAAYWKAVAFPAYLLTRRVAVAGNSAVSRRALERIGGFDTSIDFYGDDTNMARRLHKVGRVKFSLSFSVSSSARRLRRAGLIRTVFLYAINYLSEMIIHRPVTTHSRDFR